MPNPFSGRTTTSFTLARPQQTRVVVLDVTGRRVATLVDGTISAGRHDVKWDGRWSDGREAPSGVYVVRVTSGEFRATSRVVLLR